MVCFSGVPTTGAVAAGSLLVNVRRRVDDGDGAGAGASALVNVSRRGEGDAAVGADDAMPASDDDEAVLLRLPLPPFLPPADPCCCCCCCITGVEALLATGAGTSSTCMADDDWQQ